MQQIYANCLSVIFSWDRLPTDALSVLPGILPNISSGNDDMPSHAVASLGSQLNDKSVLLPNLCPPPRSSPLCGEEGA
jgi:hypothetical protein